MRNYVLIDPIAREYSGITAYSNIAYGILKNIYNTHLISKDSNESMHNFRIRVKNTIENNFSYENTIIECPDTYHSLFNIKKEYIIHVRLHGMKHIFDEINGNNVDVINYLNDLHQIQNCAYISAPSHIIQSKTEEYIHIDPVEVYPNPIHEFCSHTEDKDIDILYIGRMQKNKGIDFLNTILSFFQDKKIYIYSKEIHYLNLKGNNITKVMHDLKTKNELLRRAKTVIIPSCFESFSQIAAEGIYNGCQIITWDTVGISEYEGSMIHSVRFGNMEKFVEAIEQSLSETVPEDAFKKYIKQNNNIYTSKIKEMNFQRLFCIRPITSSTVVNSKKENRNMFKRKLRKLIHNPEQFWADSKMNKFIKSICHDNIPTSDTNISDIANDTYLSENNINRISTIQKDKIVNNAIGINEHIKISNININKNSKNTIIFRDIKCNYASEIINSIKEKCSSINFKKRYLFEYIYEDSIKCNDKDIRAIINSFDKNFNDTISKFGIAIFINPNTQLFSILRSYFQDLKIMVILTKEYSEYDTLLPEQIDVLALHEEMHDKIDIYTLRRYFIYKNHDELCNFLDIYTKESAPKHHDMLLKILGDVDFDTKYMNINTSNINCIIRLDKRCTEKNLCFLSWDEYIKYISKNIKSILVAESVFFNYKELIINSIDNNNWYTFLSLASYDGVRFEIHV